jgi:hypothetical protein
MSRNRLCGIVVGFARRDDAGGYVSEMNEPTSDDLELAYQVAQSAEQRIESLLKRVEELERRVQELERKAQMREGWNIMSANESKVRRMGRPPRLKRADSEKKSTYDTKQAAFISREHVRSSIMSDPFWQKVSRGAPSDCWPWTGYQKASGHGLTSYKSAPIHASRKAYILTHGPIASDLCVNHRCDNSACCNPSHLYLGTRADNMIDRFGNIRPEFRKATGRSRVLTDEQVNELWQMRRAGALLRECANKFDVHIATICRYITAVRRQKLDKIRADRLGNSRTIDV